MLIQSQIDAITKVFRLSDDVYREVKDKLSAEMDCGLSRDSHHTATVKMFHTFVRALPDGKGEKVCTREKNRKVNIMSISSKCIHSTNILTFMIIS